MEIIKMLADKSFPIEKNHLAQFYSSGKVKKDRHDDNLIAMMQTIGKTVAIVVSHDKLIKAKQTG